MKKLPRISEAEWQVMQVVWSSPGVTADHIIETLKSKVTWSDPTVRTLINRLLKKRALKYRREGRKYRYWPAVRQDSCVCKERRSFVERIYGGTVTPMLAALIEDAELTQADIEELKRMLDQKQTE